MNNTKKILHQKVDTEKIDYELMWKMHNWLNRIVNEQLNDEYIVVTTPNELEVLEDNQAIITIDAKVYTIKELLEAIEKAVMYDNLCK